MMETGGVYDCPLSDTARPCRAYGCPWHLWPLRAELAGKTPAARLRELRRLACATNASRPAPSCLRDCIEAHPGGMSVELVADALGCSAHTVARIEREALARMREGVDG